MRASSLFSGLALAASAAASAVPTQAARLVAREDQSAEWVEVDDMGQPKETHTPSAKTVDGTVVWENGAPHDLTATVFTSTLQHGKVQTSTGTVIPVPTADATNGKGAFPRCHNKDGDHAPFCYPRPYDYLQQDRTYYVTWDPDYFETTTKDNRTTLITIRMDWYNTTSKDSEKIFESKEIEAAWGFWNFHVESQYLKGRKDHNITLGLYSNVNGTKTKDHADYDLPLQLYKDSLKPDNPPSVPSGRTLTIALPTVFGAILLLLIGGCLWNAKSRKIGLGNVMSRRRNGYSGRKTRRAFGLGRSRDNGIQLDDAAIAGSGAPGPGDYHDVPRRNSDEGLGSLVNSPVDPSFQKQGTKGGRNVFREEMDRQERERR